MKSLVAVVLPILLAVATTAGPAEPQDDAAKFGAQEAASSLALSADGKRMVLVGPDAGPGTKAVVINLDPVSAKQIAQTDNKTFNLTGCDWSAADRLVCTLYGLRRMQTAIVPMTRIMAMDADGQHVLPLGERESFSQLYLRQFDGNVVDWLDGTGGAVLMARNHIPDQKTGSLLAHDDEGLGVDRIDTRTGKATTVERPGANVIHYISDGLGTVRIMTITARDDHGGTLHGVDTHYYRLKDSAEWRKLGVDVVNGEHMVPLAVDPAVNAAYVLQRLDGRDALYRITLDGSPKKELVFASKDVDVDDVVRVGRGGRVIGITYVTDRRKVEYFDPTYRSLAASLARAIPTRPLIHFISASADEQVLLIGAGSDVQPESAYVYDRAKKTLLETVSSRPELNGVKLSPMQPITYGAADGTQIPAYLTLPPGVTEAKNLPAIVLPHGGPAARDEWGFDWLAQYFAHRGFVVLQPNYRGSAGYGDQWYVDNGFKSWKTAIGDVCDAGRWLVAQGMADPSKLAIFGWSYGGYAALQANVLDPSLFKAAVAVAPVADLSLLKAEAQTFTNGALVSEYIGSGEQVEAGSPALHANAFKAPVLMFHGEDDFTVDLAQSRAMDKALRAAGKSSQLVVYPKLEHSLRDGTARADMLRRTDAFLRKSLNLQGP